MEFVRVISVFSAGLLLLTTVDFASCQQNGIYCNGQQCNRYEVRRNPTAARDGRFSFDEASKECNGTLTNARQALQLASLPNVMAMTDIRQSLGTDEYLWVGLRDKGGWRWVSGMIPDQSNALNPGASGTGLNKLAGCAFYSLARGGRLLAGMCTTRGFHACEDLEDNIRPNCNNVREISLNGRCISIEFGSNNWLGAALDCGDQQKRLFTIRNAGELSRFESEYRRLLINNGLGGNGAVPVWTGLSRHVPLWTRGGLRQPEVFSLKWEANDNRIAPVDFCMALGRRGLRRFPCTTTNLGIQGVQPTGAICTQVLPSTEASRFVASEISTWGPYAAVIIVLFIVVIILAIAVCCMCCRKRQKKSSSFVDYMQKGHSTISQVTMPSAVGSSTPKGKGDTTPEPVASSSSKPDRPSLRPNYDNPPSVDELKM